MGGFFRISRGGVRVREKCLVAAAEQARDARTDCVGEAGFRTARKLTLSYAGIIASPNPETRRRGTRAGRRRAPCGFQGLPLIDTSHSMPPESPTAVAPAEVSASRVAFLRGLIDFAGLFPPAKMALDDALSSFAAYRCGPDAWILGSFIIPASRLVELDRYTDLFRPDAPFPVAVLGSGGEDADRFFRALDADLESVHRFEHAHTGRVRALVFEVPVPRAVIDAGSSAIADFSARLVDAVGRSPAAFQRVFLEVGFEGEWRRAVRDAAAAVAAVPAHAVPLGLKLRSGGVSPHAFPTPEQVAFFLNCAREVRLPFKATAGLHHPIRHLNRGLEVVEHGFLNVFCAGILAHALELSEAALRQVLRSENPRAFAFDDDGFSFQDLRISTAQIEAARVHFAVSFGSCSFDEPREGLRHLGLL